MGTTDTVLSIGAVGVAGALLYWFARSIAPNNPTGAPADISTIGTDVLSEVQVTAEAIGVKAKPRGIRNNNPGNLRTIYAPAAPWNGQVGDDGGYGVYDTPESGVRAMSKQLQKDVRTYGGLTLAQIISIWAPSNENDTEAYISAVSADTGIAPGQQVDLNAYLPLIVAAIIKHENGEQPYSPDDLATWVYLA